MTPDDELRQEARKRIVAKREFWQHLVAYVIINAGLIASARSIACAANNARDILVCLRLLALLGCAEHLVSVVGHVRVEVAGRTHVPLVALAGRHHDLGHGPGLVRHLRQQVRDGHVRAEQLRWPAFFLLSASTTYHGASGMSVCTNISSFARE